VSAAVFVVASIAVATVLIGTSSTTNNDAVKAPGPTYPCATKSVLAFDGFTLAPVPGLSSGQTREACSGLRRTALFYTSGDRMGEVVLYAPGAFDTSLLTHAPRVHGEGITAYQVRLPDDATSPCYGRSSPPVAACTPLFGLAWKYAPDRWATVGFTASNATDQFLAGDKIARELAVAAAVRPAAVPLRTPIALRDLAGLTPFDASEATGYGPPARTGVSLELNTPGCTEPTPCPGSVRINVIYRPPTSTGGASIPQEPGAHQIKIGTDTATLVPASAKVAPYLEFTHGSWQVELSLHTVRDAETGTQTGANRTDTLVRIAKGMSFAPSDQNPSAWFTYDQALPR
jgi:hypothetical protein